MKEKIERLRRAARIITSKTGEAKLMRLTSFDVIEVTLINSSGEKIPRTLYRGSVSSDASKLSDNEIRRIWLDCEAQIMSTPKGDIPQSFLEMMRELKQVMFERKINLQREAGLLINYLSFFKPITQVIYLKKLESHLLGGFLI